MKKVIVLIVLVLASANISSADGYTEEVAFAAKFDLITFLQSDKYYEAVNNDSKNAFGGFASSIAITMYTKCRIKEDIKGYFTLPTQVQVDIYNNKIPFSQEWISKIGHVECRKWLTYKLAKN